MGVYLSGARVLRGASLVQTGGVFYRRHPFLPGGEGERPVLPTGPGVRPTRPAEKGEGLQGEG